MPILRILGVTQGCNTKTKKQGVKTPLLCNIFRQKNPTRTTPYWRNGGCDWKPRIAKNKKLYFLKNFQPFFKAIFLVCHRCHHYMKTNSKAFPFACQVT